MIAVDTNLFVYAHRADSPFHARAKAVVVALAEGAVPGAIPWPCVQEFYAKATHPRVFSPPSTPAQALAQLEAWFSSPPLQLLTEGPEYPARFLEVLRQSSVVGAMVHDARIAALCLAHGVSELLTADRDFGRFRALSTRNPLVG